MCKASKLASWLAIVINIIKASYLRYLAKTPSWLTIYELALNPTHTSMKNGLFFQITRVIGCFYF